MTDLPKLYHWLGSSASDAAREYRELIQRDIDERRAAEFEVRNLREECDE